MDGEARRQKCVPAFPGTTIEKTANSHMQQPYPRAGSWTLEERMVGAGHSASVARADRM